MDGAYADFYRLSVSQNENSYSLTMLDRFAILPRSRVIGLRNSQENALGYIRYGSTISFESRSVGGKMALTT